MDSFSAYSKRSQFWQLNFGRKYAKIKKVYEGGERMTLEFIDQYLEKKLEENDEFIVFTFYELRVKSDLTKEDTLVFLHLVTQKLLNMGYAIYQTKETYHYHKEEKIVPDNQLLVAIKK